MSEETIELSLILYIRRKMKNTVIGSKWGDFRLNVLSWLNNHRNHQLIQVNGVRERSLSLLQNRYGYTREEAASALDKHYPQARLE
mgnify:CR=1 FL=1